MGQKSILVFAGSARQGSFNKKLAQYVAGILATKEIAHTFADLDNYEAPVYHGDFESEFGIPKSMTAFKSLMKSHDAFLIVSPEYNGFVPPLLINTFSWCSRPEEGDSNLVATRGKYIGLMATSPGAMGGIRMLPRLREALNDLGAIIVPGPIAIGSAMTVFDDDGNLKDDQTRTRIETLIENLVKIASF